MIKPGMFISDRYEIIGKVGSGGMADVYKARDHKLNRFVAVKILKPEYGDDKKFVEKFHQEARSAAGLSHPNIVNVYDVAEDEGLHYIVMELIEGITLKKFIERKGRLEIREAIGIAIQIAQGMEAAHANHIIHRDIKPQNIIISKEGKVKVTDFGIAKATSSNTITSNAMGSVHYISPEQARGGYSDEKSDIYSLGVTIYEMISGSVPFEGDNAVSIALLHVQNEAKTLREIDPKVPVSIDRIVRKCMQKKPERRYLTVSELIVDLKRSLVEPDTDFVAMNNTYSDQTKTVILTPSELKKIQAGASAAKEPVEEEPETESVSQASIDDEEEPDILPPVNVDGIDDDEEDEDEDDELLEEDGDDEIDPKLEKLTLIGAVVCAVVIGLLLIFFVLYIMGVFDKKAETKDPDDTAATTTTAPALTESPTATPTIEPTVATVSVPTVEGKSKDEAIELIQKKGFVARFTEETSTVPNGFVIRQDPVAGTELEPGKDVNIVISIGEETVKFPSLAGKTVDEAKAFLEEEGYTVDISESLDYSDKIAEGKIIRSDPAADSDVTKSLTKVTVYISIGAKKVLVEVPSIIGRTVEEAETILTDKGLVLGTPTEVYDDSIPAGKIVSQAVSVGNKVEKNSAVDYKISLGPEATTPPPTEAPTTPPPTTAPPTPTPTPSPIAYEWTVNVSVKGSDNPFTPLAPEGEEQQGIYAGIIKVEVHDGNSRVFQDSFESNYDSFAADGYSYSFTVRRTDKSNPPKAKELEFEYSLNGTKISVSADISVDSPIEIYE